MALRDRLGFWTAARVRSGGERYLGWRQNPHAGRPEFRYDDADRPGLSEQLTARGHGGPDPIRAIQGLAQAIGFLCAGVIFVARGSVYGVTTAASLWMTSSIGMAAGAGMYKIALAGLIFAMLIVSVLWLVTRFLPGGNVPPPIDRP